MGTGVVSRETKTKPEEVANKQQLAPPQKKIVPTHRPDFHLPPPPSLMIFLSYLSTLLGQEEEDKEVMSRGERCLRLSFLLPQVRPAQFPPKCWREERNFGTIMEATERKEEKETSTANITDAPYPFSPLPSN